METVAHTIQNDPKNYRWVFSIIFLSFIFCPAAIFFLSLSDVATWTRVNIGERKALLVQLFFWGALGATIASSLFVARDIEINELERLKDNPDKTILRYPSLYDAGLYIQRLFTGGILGIVGGILLFAGLGYFEVQTEQLSAKQQYLFIIASFLIGLYQANFLDTLNHISTRMFKKHESQSDDQKKPETTTKGEVAKANAHSREITGTKQNNDDKPTTMTTTDHSKKS